MGNISSSGDITLDGNTAATVIDIASLDTSGDIMLDGNTSATLIDMGNLTSCRSRKSHPCGFAR
jgi:hypothetical protein